MDFEDNPEEAAFRAEVRSWLRENAPFHLEEELEKASFAIAGVTNEYPVADAKAWQKKKAQAGWACLHWPQEYGGRGASPVERVIWTEEEGVFGALGSIFSVGHGMCGPTLISWAREEDKRRLLPPLASGEEIWCQLFSEPAAGSDLAGLRTRAEKATDGSGDWIINGQKIWTSVAHISNWGLLLARTDPTVPKHKGLTMFFLPMDTPGLDIRPIKQANGQSSFNEVYFSDVRIPDAQRLGAEGQGWQVSLTTLMNERLSISTSIATGFPELFDLCMTMERNGVRVIDDPAARSFLAGVAIKHSGIRYTGMRAVTALSKGQVPGPENSVGKLVAASMAQDIAMYAIDILGESGVVWDESSPQYGRFQAMLLRSPSSRIAGGSDEILRNIIAERVLNLPGDIRADKNIPFKDIPTSSQVEADSPQA